MQREMRAPGVVAEVVSRKDSAGNEAFYPRVEYSLPDGTTKSVQLTEGTWPAAHERGDAVTIVYDREQPDHARIDSTSGSAARWIMPTITGVLGVVFAAVGLLALAMFRGTPANEELPS